MKKVTFEICSFVKRCYPEAIIILSTWQDEDVSDFDSLIDSNFQICQSVKPDNHGPSNINLQIVSTNSGVDALFNQGCTHILKTRTDVLLGNPEFLNYLDWMEAKGNSNAIVFSSFNSFLFRFFSLTDQVMFGTTANISRYWSVDLILPSDGVEIPESYLFLKYLSSHGFQASESFTSYQAALRDFAVIADHEQLGQIWNKGTYTSLGYRWRGTRFPHRMSPLTSWHWEMNAQNESYLEKLYETFT
jgi:hypothetical protein